MKLRIKNIWNVITKKYSIYFVLLFLIVLSSIINPNFFSPGNLGNVSRQISVTTILAFGETLLIICGMIDLSAGSVLALSGLLSVAAYKAGVPMIGAFGVAIAVGVFCNVLNALLVTELKTPPFIATLAMQTMARGAALLYTNGQNIYQIGNYVQVGQGSVLFVPTPIIFLIFILVFTWYILNHTAFGRSLYAIGGNEEAAVASGINVRKNKILAFVLHGVFVGIAGVLFMSRVNGGLPNGAINYEFHALTSSIIGGTSFSGGLGTAGGTLVGAFIVGFLNNIMNLMNVNSYLQQITRGAIIALAVSYDIWAKNRRTKIITEDTALSSWNKPAVQVQYKTDSIVKDITMSDVAREAGVSITTVSHVVNKTRYVKSATREHVLNVIQKMEYQIEKTPSAKIEYIGIVVPNITEDYYISLIKSMETFASEEGFSLLICDSNYTTEKEIKNIELLLEKKISGLILSPVDAFAYPPLLLNASIPLVLVDRQFNKHTHTFLGINNYESGRLAAEYLMKQNCKRMGFIGYAQTVYTAYHRARGYKACMREFFPQLEPAILELHYHAEDSNKKIMDFVRRMQLDALICATSDIGYQVVSTIEELGLRIPDDLKIISYDDNRWMDYLKYPISVVSQPSVEIGVQAMEELIRLISKNDIGNIVKREIFLDVEIVDRLNP